MTDITAEMMSYREAVRTVWNGWFRELPEGWHEFINVKVALFDGLVRRQVVDPAPLEIDVRVVPVPFKGLWRGARATTKDDGGTFWERHESPEDSIHLRFVEFFDWIGDDGDGRFRDLDEVICEVVASEDPLLEKGRVMLPARDVRFELEATT